MKIIIEYSGFFALAAFALFLNSHTDSDEVHVVLLCLIWFELRRIAKGRNVIMGSPGIELGEGFLKRMNSKLK